MVKLLLDYKPFEYNVIGKRINRLIGYIHSLKLFVFLNLKDCKWFQTLVLLYKHKYITTIWSFAKNKNIPRRTFFLTSKRITIENASIIKLFIVRQSDPWIIKKLITWHHVIMVVEHSLKKAVASNLINILFSLSFFPIAR